MSYLVFKFLKDGSSEFKEVPTIIGAKNLYSRYIKDIRCVRVGYTEVNKDLLSYQLLIHKLTYVPSLEAGSMCDGIGKSYF